ncbi:MAG TPA: 8-oxo-dGTP diphosphatase MutT [Gammaproteobacteria bacterium]|nr:8-oxo-dGTP diphosphatase MutT [Gammaproteobacteria bacterium]
MVYVVVGVVPNSNNEILVTQRPTQKSYSGYWEFPGGKKEQDETPYQTLVRELKEELDIDVQAAEPWQQLEYNYPEKIVFLDIWIVNQFSGQLKGMEDQAFQWVSLDKLNEIDFLPANKTILEKVIERFA